MKSVYPISIYLCTANCQLGWESAAFGVEYLLMGDDRHNQRQFTQGDHNFRYTSSAALNAAPKPVRRSGRYRYPDAVP